MVDKKGHNRTTSRSRGVRPPSLKDISERLNTSPKPSALSEITASTNLPPSGESRLKLPPSAVARANLTPSSSPRAVKTDENGRAEGDKANKEGGKEGSDDKLEVATKALSRSSSVETLKNSVAGDVSSDQGQSSNSLALSIDGYDSPTPSRTGSALLKDDAKDVSSTKEIEPIGVYRPRQVDELRHQSRAGLGRGFPGSPGPAAVGPDTPVRSKEDVPSIFVQRSTPGQSPDKVSGGGVRSGDSSPSMPSSPRSLPDDLPLEHAWTLLYDSKTYKPSPELFAERRKVLSSDWEASMLPVGTFDTIQSFCRHMNNIRQPSKLAKGASYHLFKDGIRPSWEDPANNRGGKWVLFVKSKDTNFDTCWANLVLALVGEMLDPEDHITGIVASSRPKMDRIQIWTRVKDDIEAVNMIGRRILDTIGLEPQDMQTGISLEFQGHGETVAPHKYFRIPLQRSASVSLPASAAASRQTPHRIGGPPSSPLGTHSPLSGWPSGAGSPLSPPSPRQSPGGLASVRTRIGGGAGNAFSGPLGAARRAFSTTVE